MAKNISLPVTESRVLVHLIQEHQNAAKRQALDEEGFFYVSHRKMHKTLMLPVRTINTAISMLHNKGVLFIKTRNTSHRRWYKVLVDSSLVPNS